LVGSVQAMNLVRLSKTPRPSSTAASIEAKLSSVRIMSAASLATSVPLKPIEEIETRYYLRFTVSDKPGVFAAIASCLCAENISFASIMQKEITEEKRVPVIILTHAVKEKNIRAALAQIEALENVKKGTQVIRIEG